MGNRQFLNFAKVRARVPLLGDAFPDCNCNITLHLSAVRSFMAVRVCNRGRVPAMISNQQQMFCC
jgi:hypothetical protein